MKSSTGSSHSDSWVLLAIIISGSQKGSRLEEIIAAGDFINHAIFCFEEIEGALARLSSGKYIRRKGNLFFPTEKTINFWKETQQKNSSIYEDWERIDRFIQARSQKKNAGPQKPGKNHSYKWIDREKFQQAVNHYLAKTN